jgi:hypothetical protein
MGVERDPGARKTRGDLVHFCLTGKAYAASAAGALRFAGAQKGNKEMDPPLYIYFQFYSVDEWEKEENDETTGK